MKQQDVQEVVQKGDKAQEWSNIAKAHRSAVRLKHSVEADEEINDTLGPLQEKFLRMYDDGDGYVYDSDKLTLRRPRVRTAPESEPTPLWVAK